MPPVQGASYAQAHGTALEGMVADGQLKNLRSGVATVAIPFGKWVCRASADGQLKLPLATSDIAGTGSTGMGVAVRVHDDVANSLDVLQYEIGRNVTFLDFGVVFVKVEEAVVAGGAAFVRYVAGGNGLGSFGASVGSTERFSLANSVYLAAGGANSIVPVRIRTGVGA